MPDFPNAQFTMTFKELRSDTTVNQQLKDIVNVFGLDVDASNPQVHTDNLYRAICAMWDPYEIVGETIGEFLMFFEEVTNDWYPYFVKLYKLELSANNLTVTGALQKVTSTSDSGAGSETVSGSVNKTATETTSDETTTNTDGIHVDLPNKKIDPTDIYSYPDSGDKATATSESDGSKSLSDITTDSRSVTPSTTKNGNITVTDNQEVFRLTEEAYRITRLVVREFAKKYTDCFIHLF